MGPPPKPFLKVSRRQQRRRTRELAKIDIQSIQPINAVNNPSSPTPRSLSPLIVHNPTADGNFPAREIHQVAAASNLQLFDDAAGPNVLGNNGPTQPIDTDIEMNVQAQSSTGPETAFGLKSFLANWVIKNKVSQFAVNDLLEGLQKFGHPELPLDARTLCNTPRTIEIYSLAGGSYAHYGLEHALRDQLKHIAGTESPPTLHINIGVDGVPLSKSSKSELWPILGKLVGAVITEPFLIGAFHGSGKPSSAAEFLESFLTEYTNLCNEGFTYEDRRYFVRLNAVCADTPARNFISCFPAHNSRCAKCTQPGQTLSNRRIFANTAPTLRTQETFRNGLPTEFQNIGSPFEIIGVDMIKQFPLDYMHLLCLGVMKKLLTLWVDNMGKSKAALAKIAEFNSFYISFASSIPAEFSRQPRSLEELVRWKATEFRLFLLYLGPVVLQYFLAEPQIIHFNALNCAVRILCDPRECVRNNKYAQDLMIYFVETMKLLYGEETLIYNIHNLIHLSADVLTHGPLDAFSCFSFENFLQTIKFLVKGGAQPLAQIMKRLAERSIHLVSSSNLIKTGYRLVNRKNRSNRQFLNWEGCTDSYQEIQFPGFSVTDRAPNNCCYLSNNSVVLIEHICYCDGVPIIVGREFIDPAPIPNYPCDSRDLFIFEVNTLSERQSWTIDKIDRKGFPIPNKGTECLYVFPLIHSDV